MRTEAGRGNLGTPRAWGRHGKRSQRQRLSSEHRRGATECGVSVAAERTFQSGRTREEIQGGLQDFHGCSNQVVARALAKAVGSMVKSEWMGVRSELVSPFGLKEKEGSKDLSA